MIDEENRYSEGYNAGQKAAFKLVKSFIERYEDVTKKYMVEEKEAELTANAQIRACEVFIEFINGITEG